MPTERKIKDRDGDRDDDSDEEPDTEGFEKRYLLDRSYEFLAEDEEGRLLPEDPSEGQRRERKRIDEHYKTAGVKRGLIRYTFLILDASETSAADDPEFKPNRFSVLVHSTKQFIRMFFDQNPLSQIGVIFLRNGRADLISAFSASPEAHLRKLSGSFDLSGSVSLQNGLEHALEILKSAPGHGHREIVAMLSAVSTCDPGNIFETLERLGKESVRVTIVGLIADVYVRHAIAQTTKGRYMIPDSEERLNQCLAELVPAPAAVLNAVKPMLVRMGFPVKNPDGHRGIAFEGADCRLTDGSYTCNRCGSRVADLPCCCHGCGLTLVSAPQLARSYHHLFPVHPFDEITIPEDSMAECYACLKPLTRAHGVLSRCRKCEGVFCFECDMYIHEILHNCPKCELL